MGLGSCVPGEEPSCFPALSADTLTHLPQPGPGRRGQGQGGAARRAVLGVLGRQEAPGPGS